jgi:hypothetical protein
MKTHSHDVGAEVVLRYDRPQGDCGPVRMSLGHGLRRSAGGSQEDLLEASLTLRNTSDRSCEVQAGFLTGVRPCHNAADQPASRCSGPRSSLSSSKRSKALFASDCSMGNFCLWGDDEGGDHCYDRLLGHELYRKLPIRYMAALGDKPWLPCAWLYKSLWPAQVDLARKAGAAVGVTNGWGDGLGLTRLPEDAKRQMLRDIESLVKS